MTTDANQQVDTDTKYNRTLGWVSTSWNPRSPRRKRSISSAACRRINWVCSSQVWISGSTTIRRSSSATASGLTSSESSRRTSRPTS